MSDPVTNAISNSTEMAAACLRSFDGAYAHARIEAGLHLAAAACVSLSGERQVLPVSGAFAKAPATVDAQAQSHDGLPVIDSPALVQTRAWGGNGISPLAPMPTRKTGPHPWRPPV